MEQITNETKTPRKHLTMEERLAQLERKEKKALAVGTKRKAKWCYVKIEAVPNSV